MIYSSTMFGMRLKMLRKECNINQSDLARDTKILARTISHFEKGVRKPTFDNLLMLADTLDVSLDYLVGRTDIMDKQSYINILFKNVIDLNREDIRVVAKVIDALAAMHKISG